MGPVTISVPSPAAARLFVRRQLEAAGALEVSEDAELAVSELVTNAMAHGHASHPVLGVTVDDATVRIEVSDDGPPVHLTPKAPDPTRTGGFGLFIVESLAARWGTAERGTSPDGQPDGTSDGWAGGTTRGKTVWFEIDLTD
jgi:anti-sigma regulatory factor (Ser/Thr protein kinase)